MQQGRNPSVDTVLTSRRSENVLPEMSTSAAVAATRLGFLSLYLTLWGLACVHQVAGYNTGFTANVSRTLDNLLAGGRYDKRIRPDMGGDPKKFSSLVSKRRFPVEVFCYTNGAVIETSLKSYRASVGSFRLSAKEDR
ncbi:hypothetical protein J6590_009508 [Homalodisca vitripennis]|nr:hypothetical protein J6590_009508 [Homalodisca vitripennis]